MKLQHQPLFLCGRGDWDVFFKKIFISISAEFFYLWILHVKIGFLVYMYVTSLNSCFLTFLQQDPQYGDNVKQQPAQELDTDFKV